jgi:glutamate mutase epsilon subunit
MQQQKTTKTQKRSFRTTEYDKHIEFDSELMEHGDPDFIDMRIQKLTRKKKGFFESLFS